LTWLPSQLNDQLVAALRGDTQASSSVALEPARQRARARVVAAAHRHERR
jgi:hypothetical protein